MTSDSPATTFAQLNLSPELLTVLEAAGYTNATEIQAKAIPLVVAGHDVLGCAQTGTGKTASYALPMIEAMRKGRARARMPRSLVLAPTREIALQVADTFALFAPSLGCALLIGGTSPVEQEKLLARGVDVLVATPGRLLDHIERGRIMLMDIRVVVIDEADRMLDMGFIPDIERIIGMLPPQRQTLMFSATMPADIRKLADRFLRNPQSITIAPKVKTAATITQYLCTVSASFPEKRAALRTLLKQDNIEKAIIFCNRKRDVAMLAKSLSQHGFSVGELHGDMSQSERLSTLERFKADEIKLLAASDVAARGIHIDSLPVVINFDVPHHAEDYVHRIGRTGRAGQTGYAYTFFSPDQQKFLDAIIEFCQPVFTPHTGIVKTVEENEKSFRTDNHAREGEQRGQRRRRAPRDTSSPSTSENVEDIPLLQKDTPPASPPRRESRRPSRYTKNNDSNPIVFREEKLPERGLGDDMPAFLKIPLSL